MTKSISELPSVSKIKESPYELEFIREKLSGMFENHAISNQQQLAVLELILCLSNEISLLKDKVSKLEK